MLIGNYSDHLSSLEDPNQGRSLEDIPDPSERILSLIVRNKHKIHDEQDYVKIRGSLDFVQGLEYHYNNFLSHLHTLAAKANLQDNRMLDNEAVAYLHRLGQFYYFARSLKLLEICPKIKELYLFRRKNIGHRSIDCSRVDEDTPQEMMWQAGCFQRRMWEGKADPKYDREKVRTKMEMFLTPKRYLSDEAFISYQIISNGNYATFVPQKDNPIILKEIEGAYTRLFASRN